jgi:hypothetical protein
MKLSFIRTGDSIVTAWAEPASGPGWSNQPLWVIVKDGDGKLREECIQPEEQDQVMRTLYAISASVHFQLKRSIKDRMT